MKSKFVKCGRGEVGKQLMDRIIQGLTSADEAAVSKSLIVILQDGVVADPESSEFCEALVKALENHPSISSIICEVVALLARTENFRSVAASTGLFLPALVPLLTSQDIDTQIQVLRAIGNLCHDEDRCREQFLATEGPLHLNNLLKQCIAFATVHKYSKLKTVTCGCLLNICCQNEKLSEAMFAQDIVESLSLLMSKEEDDRVLCMALQTMAVLLEADCCDISKISSSSLPDTLALLVKKFYHKDSDVIGQILDVIEMPLSQENESSDLWKVTMVKSGCVLQLLSLSDHELMVKVFNTIAQIMSSDDSLALLFTNQELWESVLGHMRDNTLTPNIRAAATLVVANMARTDSNCEDLIKRGILNDLITIIEIPSTEEIVKLHFAAMSALRNLSLLGSHKLLFLQESIIDKVITLLNQASDPNIIIKAIGCLRLLATETEVCKHIVLVNPVIKRVCNACELSGFPHIKIEGSRLLAAIIKNCHAKEAISKVIEDGGTQWLLYLLTTEHIQLKNEGLVALNITASLNIDTFFKTLACNEYSESFCQILEETSSEVIENCLTLLQLLFSSDMVKTELYSESLAKRLKKLLLHEKESIKEKASKLLPCE